MLPIQASISVGLSVVSLLAKDVVSMLCPSCREPIEIHQPDAGFPDRILWTCDACRTWFLVDRVPKSSDAVLVCLPDGEHFVKAVGR